LSGSFLLAGADAALVDFVKVPALVLGEVAPVPIIEGLALVDCEMASVSPIGSVFPQVVRLDYGSGTAPLEPYSVAVAAQKT